METTRISRSGISNMSPGLLGEMVVRAIWNVRQSGTARS
jgi:hypothetical protein